MSENKEPIRCKYCMDGEPISKKNTDELGIELHGVTGYLIAYAKDKNGWDTSVSAPINFCPMCGRSLR
jgi:hypothetical protein